MGEAPLYCSVVHEHRKTVGGIALILTVILKSVRASVHIIAEWRAPLARFIIISKCGLALTALPAISAMAATCGSPTTSPTTLPALVTPGHGDDIGCTTMNTPKSAAAVLTAVKNARVISDPVNGTNNPKAIPGAIVHYSITITNTGTTPIDGGTIVITDPVPEGVVLSVASPKVQFMDGTPSSGLAFNPATDVSYSAHPGGGSPFTYAPAPDANGYDAAVRDLRIAPTGSMAGATAFGQPSITLEYSVRLN
ncbi:DUF11 domain-containing protein (plasmid) [Sphingomonas paeninsulae]|uniref:DUF11 domain-containing protein n=1 Tax=Sphingomonas paeninsulae TaxID=2319844 RepID=A0A494THC8_SPHPE|nr:DUF11 domain-containing protein [Sphingomonas paeninsulae]AYJ85246.1 DUF11 domain-containing protein [Sphingomonas paeninsulae]